MRLARPILPACAGATPASTSASISASASSESLKPSGPKNLMPLSSAGLWLAEIMMPRSARMDGVKSPTAGVGTGPSSSTFMPVEVRPAVRAFSNM